MKEERTSFHRGDSHLNQVLYHAYFPGALAKAPSLGEPRVICGENIECTVPASWTRYDKQNMKIHGR